MNMVYCMSKCECDCECVMCMFMSEYACVDASVYVNCRNLLIFFAKSLCALMRKSVFCLKYLTLKPFL